MSKGNIFRTLYRKMNFEEEWPYLKVSFLYYSKIMSRCVLWSVPALIYLADILEGMFKSETYIKMFIKEWNEFQFLDIGTMSLYALILSVTAAVVAVFSILLFSHKLALKNETFKHILIVKSRSRGSDFIFVLMLLIAAILCSLVYPFHFIAFEWLHVYVVMAIQVLVVYAMFRTNCFGVCFKKRSTPLE